MNSLGFLDHVDRRTENCLRNIEELGSTVDMLLHMAHREAFELRATADRLRWIIEKLELRAAEIDKRGRVHG